MVKNVLIVDDDQEMLLALKSGFSKYQDTFSVITAEDGIAAVEKLKTNLISLVVTDLKMPRMDGFELLEHIMEHYPDIPVIVITGYSTPEMEKMAREGGAVGYIAKPFMLENLAKRVMETLRKESEGGTLHSVSSGIFLQLMEMEQKTCTIRLEDKTTGKKGVLFFKDGELLDARVHNLTGKPAAYQIFAWDKVTITIQNICPEMENKIQSDLQPLILEATRLKDEATEVTHEPEEESQKFTEINEQAIPENHLNTVSSVLEAEIGKRCGVEDIYHDDSWNGFISQMNAIGAVFHSGALKVGYIDRGDKNDFVILADKKPIIVAVSPRCPRDKIIQVLSK